MTESFQVSSCAKFILGGEHSVVHDGQALAFPLVNLRLKLSALPEEPGVFRVNGENLPSEKFELVQTLKKKMNLPNPEEGLLMETHIPVGAGLGSSAAFCTALAKLGTNLSGEALAQRALCGEQIFHGTPSGVDPYTVALEQALVFSAKRKSFRFLNTEKFQEFKLCFALFDTKERHSTLKLVEKVRQLRESTPLIWENLISSLADNAKDMEMAFEKNPHQLGRLMNDTHFRLLQLGVSTECLDDLAEELRKQGALGAKLTGAGGGGFVLGLFNQDSLESLPNSLQPQYLWTP